MESQKINRSVVSLIIKIMNIYYVHLGYIITVEKTDKSLRRK